MNYKTANRVQRMPSVQEGGRWACSSALITYLGFGTRGEDTIERKWIGRSSGPRVFIKGGPPIGCVPARPPGLKAKLAYPGRSWRTTAGVNANPDGPDAAPDVQADCVATARRPGLFRAARTEV